MGVRVPSDCSLFEDDHLAELKAAKVDGVLVVPPIRWLALQRAFAVEKAAAAAAPAAAAAAAAAAK